MVTDLIFTTVTLPASSPNSYTLSAFSTGLHFHDVDQLLRVLHRLRDGGNTVVVIKHNLDVIKTADWGGGRRESWGAYYCGGYAGAGGGN